MRGSGHPAESAPRPLLLWEEQGLALVSACQCMTLPSVWDFLPALRRVSILSIRCMVTLGKCTLVVSGAPTATWGRGVLPVSPENLMRSWERDPTPSAGKTPIFSAGMKNTLLKYSCIFRSGSSLSQEGTRKCDSVQCLLKSSHGCRQKRCPGSIP